MNILIINGPNLNMLGKRDRKHYGYSLRDALADTGLPIVEVHLSNINRRDAFRKTDVIKDITVKVVMGLKEKSYYRGLEILTEHIVKLK